MTKLRDFQIALTQQEAVFAPGMTVSGHVVVSATGPVKTRGIQIRLRGVGFIRGRERPKDAMRTQKEEYVQHAYTLFGEPKSRMHSEMHPGGTNMYPFEFCLPFDLPPSVEVEQGENMEKGGYVRYHLEAEFFKPLKANKIRRVYITVTSTLDLNNMSNVTMPAEGEAEMNTTGCCCPTGGVTINFKVNRQGHVAGECVHVVGKVVNRTGKRIRGTTTSLRMLVTLQFTRTRTMTLTREVAAFEKGLIGRRQTQSIDTNILIPPVPPSGMPHCHIIDINYELTVTAHTKKADLTASMPIVIGTVPLRNIRTTFTTAPCPTLERLVSPARPLPPVPERPDPSAPTSPSAPSYTEATPDDIQLSTMESDEPPPPSYHECVLGRVSMLPGDDDTQDADAIPTSPGNDVMWAPKYRYFTWNRNDPPPSYSDAQ